MKLSLIFLVALMIGKTAVSHPALASHSLAKAVVNQVYKELKNNGLQIMDAYHPLLPRPQIPAMMAIVNRAGLVLAYFDEEPGVGGSTYVFKNPNGGMRHSVSFGFDSIRFVTPYLGAVASSNRVYTGYGEAVSQFFCRNESIHIDYFQKCIYSNWVRLIVDQLVRFK